MSVVYYQQAAGTGALFCGPSCADPLVPKLTEFGGASGWKLHMDTYGWEPKVEQKTNEEGRYGLAEAVETFGRAKVQVEPLEIVYNPQTPADPNFVAATKLVEGSEHWVLDRRGVASTTALAADQYVRVYKVRVGVVSEVPIKNDDGETLKLHIPLAVTYRGKQLVKVVA